jgi:hypothetical protein
VVECGGLENRCPPYRGPGVRIPLSPLSRLKTEENHRKLHVFGGFLHFWGVLEAYLSI